MSRFGMAAAGLAVLLVFVVFLVVSALSDEGLEAAASPTTVSLTTTTAADTVASDGSTTTEAGANVVAALAEATTTGPSTTTTTSPPTTTTTSSTTSTSSTTTTTTTTVPTTVAAPPFISSVAIPAADDLYASWEPGCPLAPADLRILTMSHWNYSGSVSTGKLVVAAGMADQVVAIFRDLYEESFPIERMVLVDEYNGDDDKSMAANNTSAFNCRVVTGGSSYSEHSYGRAIDINPLVNPYVKGSTVLPPAGSAYVDRGLDAPGMIHAGDEVVQAFAARGWIWGGTWNSLKDYQHFSTTGK